LGAKTALLAYAAGDPVESLRRAREYMRTHRRTTYRMGPDGKLIQAET
jgi:hypothetical protein